MTNGIAKPRAQNEAKGYLVMRLGCLLILFAGLPLQNEATAGDNQKGKVTALPQSRGGQDLFGTKLAALTFDRWLRDGTNAKKPNEPTEARVTLYRWWTDECPYCERTLPAVESLRKKYEPKGLRVVAVYHTKPAGPVEDDRIIKAADRIGYGGAIAVDPEWAVLKSIYLEHHERRATSISLLVDREGVVRFVHPGVQYFPSDDAACTQENADFRMLDDAIATLLQK